MATEIWERDVSVGTSSTIFFCFSSSLRIKKALSVSIYAIQSRALFLSPYQQVSFKGHKSLSWIIVQVVHSSIIVLDQCHQVG